MNSDKEDIIALTEECLSDDSQSEGSLVDFIIDESEDEEITNTSDIETITLSYSSDSCEEEISNVLLYDSDEDYTPPK